MFCSSCAPKAGGALPAIALAALGEMFYKQGAW